MRLAILAGLVCCVAGMASSGDGERAKTVEGVWVTEDGRGRVEIAQGEDGRFSGKMIWLSEPNWPEGDPEAGQARTDRENPDASKRSRPIIGLCIMDGFKYDGKNTWKKGRVYDGENGKTYRAKMTLKKGKLHLRGFIGISLIGRTTIWTRYVPEEDTVEEKPASE